MKAFGTWPSFSVGTPGIGDDSTTHDHVTSIHVHTEADIPDDLDLVHLESDDAMITGELNAQEVEAAYVKAIVVETEEFYANNGQIIGPNGAHYISRKPLPIDAASPAANETEQSDKTIVVRSREHGTQVDNLVVRGRATAANDPYTGAAMPGIWTNILSVADQISMFEDATLIYKHTGAHNCIEHFPTINANAADWVLGSDGKLSSYDALETTVAMLADSNEDGAFIAEENSLYIGRVKFGFNKTADKLTLKYLVPSHIPGKLAADGFTSGDLGGFAMGDMTVKRWRNRARIFYSDDSTKVNDVFTNAYNSVDWESRDAPGVTEVADDVADINTKLGAITQAEFSYLDGVTSSIQTQLGGITTVSNDVAAINTKLGDITQTEFSYLDGVTSNIQDQIDGVGLGESATVESTTAAQFEVKSTNALISGVAQIKMSMVLDRGATANDFEYRTWNHYGHLLHSRIRDSVDLGLFGFDEDTGCMTISGGRYNDVAASSTLLQQWVGVPTDLSAQFLGRASFRHGLRLPVSFTPGSATAAGTEGDLHQDGDYVWVRGASEWKKAELQAFGASSGGGGGTVVRSTGHENPGGSGTGWPSLPNDIILLSVEHSTAGAVRRRMPASVPDGFSFRIIATHNQGVLNLYWSGQANSNFYAGSLGYTSNVLCAVNMAVYNPVSCFYIDATKDWYVVAG